MQNKEAKTPSRSTLSQRIYRRHILLVRDIRDMYIFVQQAIAALNAAKATYSPSDRSGGRNKRYYVPAAGRTKFAQRTDPELIAIYDRYLSHGLYETFLVGGVSIFESFLGDVFRFVFDEYPYSVTRKYPNVPTCSSVPIEVVFGSTSKEEIIDELLNRHLSGVFYSRPNVYIGYLCELTGANREDPAFDDYIEIKATRDLIVHGELKVNQVYLEKAGAKARGELGETIAVNEQYFAHFVGTVTRISGILERDSRRKFPLKPTQEEA